MNGGDRIAEVLQRQGVQFVFTLCGGHISPILVGAKRRGLRVIDVRHEATAVFAADAVARLTGIPGVAAVTAGPGVTNTITAIKNAQLAQSPLVLLGGATATLLKGRGALQDIDQMSLFEPHVKWCCEVKRVRDLVPTLQKAFRIAQEGVPGPVFVETPVDLLYDEKTVREMSGAKAAGDMKGLVDVAIQTALRAQIFRVFRDQDRHRAGPPVQVLPARPTATQVRKVKGLLSAARKPVMILGSQATLQPEQTARLVQAVERIGVPVFLSGMARGLMGRSHPLWFRHARTRALREADMVILAGVPCDFRLNYGLQIPRRATLVSVNRGAKEVRKNRRPTVPVVADPAEFLFALADHAGAANTATNEGWLRTLSERDDTRNREIQSQSLEPAEGLLNPLAVCGSIEQALDERSVLVADGGDFVGTASYITAPRSPLSWLDPGAFGTLGVGAGFALGAKLVRPESEVWILYGDGSVGYTLPEMDTFARHGVGVIAVVGNDAGWTQIARDQVVLLQDDVGTVLERTDYHRAAEGFGARGWCVDRQEQLQDVLSQAKQAASEGRPVLINAHIGKTDFRKGSMSM